MNDWDDIYAQGSTITSVSAGSGPVYDTINTASNTSNITVTSTIQGKMLSIVQDIDISVWLTADPEEIKMAMVAKIAGELIKSKMIEFTREEDAMNLKMKIRARLFVTPDDQVRLLRKAGY